MAVSQAGVLMAQETLFSSLHALLRQQMRALMVKKSRHLDVEKPLLSSLNLVNIGYLKEY